ncbi:XRE family transcriptional regulator [Pseudomonas sp. NPDC096917]|uniref:XRE family transcriptional regulator n=1 Tax=Pseudomonas sp. NPDC096917 TaxID=3364483 RepID=UPI00383BCD42
MKTDIGSSNLEDLEDVRIAEQRLLEINANRTKTIKLEEVNSLIPVEKSAIPDNVYADIWMANPEEMLRKARIVAQISQVIKRSEGRISRAASIIGLSEIQLTALLLGHFQDYREVDLMECLEILHQNKSFAGAKLGE